MANPPVLQVDREAALVELLACLHEAMNNQPAAFTLRSVGVVGSVLTRQYELLKAHDQAARLAEQERAAKLIERRNPNEGGRLDAQAIRGLL